MTERGDKILRSFQLSRLLVGMNTALASGLMLMGWVDLSGLTMAVLVVLVVAALLALAVSFKSPFWGLLVGNGSVAGIGLWIVTTQGPFAGVEIAHLAVVVVSLYFLTNGIFASTLADKQEQA